MTTLTDDAATGPAIQPARWQAVAFVCGRCEERKGAPKSLDAKRVGKRLREGFRDAGLRSRVVTTNCMGLCPRGAIVAAVSLAGGPLVVAQLAKKRDASAVVERLAGPTPNPNTNTNTNPPEGKLP